MERRTFEEPKSTWHSGFLDQAVMAVAEMHSLSSLFFSTPLLSSREHSPATNHLGFLWEFVTIFQTLAYSGNK